MKKNTHINIILFIVCILSIIAWYTYYISEGFQEQKNIIGYIHICQHGDWRRSLDILINSIKKSGLYDESKEIRFSVLSKNNKFEDDVRFNDPKIKIVYKGVDSDYERPTLLEIRKNSFIDPPDTKYYYLHTKGIRHFNTANEGPVLKWIYSMLKCNIESWKTAVDVLESHETYGCNYNDLHYSGNFWWATAKHIQKLPDTIPGDYIAPENWILTNKDGVYCADNCGNSYTAPYPDKMYG